MTEIPGRRLRCLLASHTFWQRWFARAGACSVRNILACGAPATDSQSDIGTSWLVNVLIQTLPQLLLLLLLFA